MYEGAGYEVMDIGEDITTDAFVEAVKEHTPDILGMSAMLTTTMTFMEQTIKSLMEAGLRNNVKVIIGGAPVTQDFADQIGADGYASNSAEAVDLAKQLTQE